MRPPRRSAAAYMTAADAPGPADHSQWSLNQQLPAVAVEHRQRPQIDAVPRHAPGQDVAHAVQVRAPVVVDDALGFPVVPDV
jgi:hypothetical protein